VRRILDGAADELEPQQLKYIGAFGKERVKIGKD
jgi:hypothetical protein